MLFRILVFLGFSLTAVCSPVKRAPLECVGNIIPDVYIVLLKREHTLDTHCQTIGRNTSEFTDFNHMKELNGYVAKINHDTVQRIREDPGVKLVECDRLLVAKHPSIENGPGPMAPPLNPMLPTLKKRGFPLTRVQNAPGGLRMLASTSKLDGTVGDGDYDHLTSSGEGVDVYVMDTGVQIKHPYFQGRASNLGDAKPHDQSPYVDEVWGDIAGHGTHVAGTIAAASFGVAPRANIISVKVLKFTPDGNVARTSSLATAVTDIFGRHNKRKANEFDGNFRGSIINMSFSWEYSSAFAGALQVARFYGITAYAAAGNVPRDVDKENVHPCTDDTVTCIGATNKNYEIWDSSSYGKSVVLAGPGLEIRSLGTVSPFATINKSGTSMATAHVSGAGAIFTSWLGLADAATNQYVFTMSKPGQVRAFPGNPNIPFVHTGISDPDKWPAEPFRYGGEIPAPVNRRGTHGPAADHDTPPVASVNHGASGPTVTVTEQAPQRTQ